MREAMITREIEQTKDQLLSASQNETHYWVTGDELSRAKWDHESQRLEAKLTYLESKLYQGAR